MPGEPLTHRCDHGGQNDMTDEWDLENRLRGSELRARRRASGSNAFAGHIAARARFVWGGLGCRARLTHEGCWH